jgi:hypothetical protein
MKTNCALFIEWGMPIHGRETKALEEFMNHVTWWNDLKSKGKIADFHVFGDLTGGLAQRAGVAILEGTDQQIQALHMGEDFRSHLNRAAICVDNVRVNLMESGDAMTARMQRYGKNLKEVLG